ncbi:hypothetical protein HOG17_03020 [Candidatus Peregrinibacteria bacterium]|jgi:hypothetical protein|nr:hypothetical protein [Candidatus Peregrinibacteria bacterium]MBT4148562.1 hypothetical protein [Candidatus Peregrinibacteria bacterium]MBT4366457.1 hypothetical protein [Candidatus Peregrinibacteria bacterium]MBT4455989.1 hypothetical protein [Candidatus Peregrinibacteria bacterium]
MQKFTVFTVLLTIVVVVVAAETFVNKYLPAVDGPNDGVTAEEGYNLPSELELSDRFQSNVLGADLIGNPVEEEVVADIGLLDTTDVPLEIVDSSGDVFDFMSNDDSGLALSDGGTFDIEDFSRSYDDSAGPVSYVRNDQIVNSGFIGGYLVDEETDGMLYKSIPMTDLVGIDVKKYAVTNGSTTFAKIYAIVPDNAAQVGEVYEVLKMRASETGQSTLNETNQFGSASFYMNDSRRDSVAFLTVRLGSKIFGFSYPKQYHPQVRNLVSNLMLGM